MNKKTSTRGDARGRRRAGRPRRYDLTTCLAVYCYIENQKRRTGYSVNKICKHGSFAWYESGSPEWCSDGPDHPTKQHEIKGRTLHRCYYEAVRFLNAGSNTEKCHAVESLSQDAGADDSPQISGSEPEWAVGWIGTFRAESLIKSIGSV
jgi:hypothetical protein